jgi:hypothetical protein
VTDSDDDKDQASPPNVLDARNVVFDWSDVRWYLGERGYGVNPGEFKVDGTYFITNYGERKQIGAVKGGIAVQDDATEQGFIMYSQQSVHDRLCAPGAEPLRSNSDHLIAVKHEGSQWYYNDNAAWYIASVRALEQRPDRLLPPRVYELPQLPPSPRKSATPGTSSPPVFVLISVLISVPVFVPAFVAIFVQILVVAVCDED